MKYIYTFLFALTLLLNVVPVNALLPPASNNKTQTQQKWNTDLYKNKAHKATPVQTEKKDYSYRSYKKSTSVHAILFAVDDYKDRMPNLNGCVNDMERAQNWLEETHSIQDGNIQVLLNTDATYAAMTNALAKAKEQKVDRLIVMISCHGGSFNGKSFIVPQDFKDMNFEATEKNADTIQTLKRSNRVPLSDILEALKASNVPEVLLVLDACRDTQKNGESFMREFQDLMKNDKSFQKNNGILAVITSCSFGQKAEEYVVNGKNYGKFMYFFTEGLEGKADFAGCYDNQVTLTEAYNYAYSQMNGSQTPEIFLASSKNMILAQYKKFTAPANPQDESDLGFLLRTGAILCDISYTDETNSKGLKALDCVLENVPNNALALSIRGSVYRCQGNYRKALLDWGKVGQKLQIYAGAKGGDSKKEIPILTSPKEGAEVAENKAKWNALLTVSGMNGNYLQISEIDNQPLKKCVWIHNSKVHWNYKDAGNSITATASQGSRNYGTTSSTPLNTSGAGRVSTPAVSPTSGLP